MPPASLYASPLPGLATPSPAGGLFTLLASTLAALLLLSSLYQHALIDANSHLSVAANPDPSATVTIDVSVFFPHLSCSELSLDVSATRPDSPEDSAGRPLPKKHRKQPAPLQKRRLSSRERSLLADLGFGWVPEAPADDPQLRGDPARSKLGCAVAGAIPAGRVGGSFRVALADNVWGQVALLGASRVARDANCSHYVERVGFGRDFP
ncbi:hypothetical protein TeGR_g3845, partial [Tetraparma gracilis]